MRWVLALCALGTTAVFHAARVEPPAEIRAVRSGFSDPAPLSAVDPPEPALEVADEATPAADVADTPTTEPITLRVAAADTKLPVGEASAIATFDQELRRDRVARTDKRGGRLRFDAPRGWRRVFVKISAPGFADDHIICGPDAFADGPVWVLLEPGVSVVGLVYTRDTNQPVRGATIRLFSFSAKRRNHWRTSQPPTAVATTDAHGKFRFDGVPNDPVRILVMAPSHVTESSIWEVSPVTTLRIPLSPACRVRGIVRLADGTPISGATVTATVAGRALGLGAGARAVTGSRGEYELDCLPLDERFSVNVWGTKGCALRRGLVGTAPGEKVPCDLTLLDRSSLRIRVLLPSAEPAEGAAVRIGSRYYRTDERGWTRFKSLPEGHHRVRVKVPGFAEFKTGVDTVHGRKHEILVQLRAR